jgi:hypothetical protein
MARNINGKAINELFTELSMDASSSFFNSVVFTACVLDRIAALGVNLEAGMWTTV